MDYANSPPASDHQNGIKSAGKLRRSCESCRAFKGRCLPSKDDPTHCQRCARDGKPCVFLEAKARPKRSKTSKTRVAEMEQKLDGILSILACKSQPSKDEGVVSTMFDSQPADLFEDPLPTFQFLPSSMPSMGSQGPRVTVPSNSFSLPGSDGADAIERGLISRTQAKECLALFQSRAVSFPFVLVPPETSLDQLRFTKPFLLQAIFTTTMQGDIDLQNKLEFELRQTLARKCIVNGERNIDLLQGLLVYLTWYQYYYCPEVQQLYQLAQMTTSMAIDLRIHRPSRSHPQEFNLFAFDESQPHARDPALLLEEKRVFLGCYYLSSALCQALRKPNALKYGSYIEECSQVLSEKKAADTDWLIPHFIRLQKLAEDVSQAYGYDDCQSALNGTSDSLRIEVMSADFNHQLNMIRAHFPPQAWKNPVINTSYYSLGIYVNEVGLHACMPSAYQLSSGSLAGTASWYHSTSRTEALIRCLQFTKEYMERCLATSSYEFSLFTLPEYARLIYAITILGKYTSGCDSPLLSPLQLRNSANMLHYLDVLSEKLGSMVTFKDGRVQETVTFWMKSICEQTRKFFAKVATLPPIAENYVVLGTEVTFTNLIPSIDIVCMEADLEEASKKSMWGDIMADLSPPPDADRTGKAL